jgi:hypothetical protein
VSWEFALIAMVVASVGILVFVRLGLGDYFLPAFCSAAVWGVTVKVCREDGRRLWFWVAMIAMGGVQAWAVMHWGVKIVSGSRGQASGPIWLPIAFVELCAMLGAVSLLEKLIASNRVKEPL